MSFIYMYDYELVGNSSLESGHETVEQQEEVRTGYKPVAPSRASHSSSAGKGEISLQYHKVSGISNEQKVT
jgi:hypothetical protein